MRELKQDWRDVFGSFRVAFDVWKLVFAFAGVVVTLLVLWGLGNISTDAPTGSDTVKAYAGWIIPIIVSGILLLGMFGKFAASETGLSSSKVVMLLATALVLGGLVVLCVFTETANAWGRTAGVIFLLLMIWGYFGGAITRIAAVEIANDDRIGLGEAGRFACRKYGAYLGATVLPAAAVLFLGLCCALFGVIFRVPYLNFFLTLILFFLVPLTGFLMFLVGLGGIVGSPLMYPAVSCEANDSFDAISRAYSYVFGRPWRYLFFNVAGALYGLACSFFVAFFVKYMLYWSFAAVDYGSGGYFNGTIRPLRQDFLRPLNDKIVDFIAQIGRWVQSWDITGYVTRCFEVAKGQLNLAAYPAADLDKAADANWAEKGAALVIAIVVYAVVGLVIAYIVSLFFSIQTTIYLLLRKSVDGAEMTEVYREEDEEALAVTPEAEKKDAAEGAGAEKKDEKKES